ncbi:ABC-type branched-subunit amino acid transport system ATPase component [Pseudomonas marginalis]|nr:ABC-type branched-subunit amino acid transport system ATPase component [Pseudomonas marginalis]MCP1524840.1 ABC-type branched-subunit amino acid transport system ATPase component [Pseudomonas marginalis]MDQ0502899.1 ABC-type branched-subunit amino acid transport system ATPase component [Pseudomonas marginalis]
MSFLIAEQNINVALNYASQGYVLDTVRVVLSGSVVELLARGDLHDIYLGKQ